ncbi:MAG: hypothetical protein U1C70_07265 [Sediminibacterium sp.]|jgi:hypothetical protein|uniref:hypothetical protein n=1 Tax=Sediminibacterium sp. TaxID=1917865 RepID=UPI002ABC4C96|nr:hypothetical protein [Sediminibacterium sp.]MDZ4071606.1 hypothetical protein [Sediminibacterium sp.]
MKTPLIIIVILFTLTISAKAQKRISYAYTEITKVQYDTCRQTIYLAVNRKIKKQADQLIIPIIGKSSIVFKDNTSDENFHEFSYSGDIIGTMLSMVKRIDHHKEELYLINRSTGAVDTLIGEPVFAENMKDFVCISNRGTDEKQYIQICELRNGSMKKRILLPGKPDTFFMNIGCVNRNFFSVKDNKDRYWKLDFKISGE